VHGLVALALGQIAGFLVQPDPLAAVSAWKFGLGLPVTLIAVLVASRLRALVAVAILGLVAVLNFVLSFRSMTLVVLMTAVVTLAAVGKGARTGKRIVLSLPFAAAMAWCLAIIYQRLAEAGSLGVQAQLKLQIEGVSTPLQMLLGGRREIFYSLPSILDSPILGLGPSATLTTPVIRNADRLLTELGIDPQPLSTGATLPTHSFLMGAWAEAGILGLLFWVVLGVALIRRLITILNGSPSPFAVLPVTFLTVLTVWNILYSPYGATERTILAITVVAVRVFAGNPQRRKVRRLNPVHSGRVALREST
jgi:O-antigen ligase